MTELLRPQRALLSLSDKSGLLDLARALVAAGVELLSTGGTATALRAAGLAVKDVSEVTGFPEIMDGRVKTLHPKIHGGLLARRDSAGHRQAMDQHAIAAIDLLVVNLYPFAATLASGAGFDDCLENIDIGGPAMLRGAAKNHAHVAVVVDPADYPVILAELAAGGITATTRRRLARKTFAHTAAYDAAIAAWLAKREGEALPEEMTLGGRRQQLLRYGENPHQQAALYFSGPPTPGIARARQLQGKELSYNNLADADAALECVAEFERPAVVIVKHANPCGVAEGKTLLEAYHRALACDSTSAFGGIVAVNRSLDVATAKEITQLFTEVVVAPEVESGVEEVFAAKKNLRLLVTGGLPDPAAQSLVVKSLAGGFLLQTRDHARLDPATLKVVTQRAPTADELADLLFAFRVVKHIKSNAIVYARQGASVGIGAGQMSRVDSVRIAAWKAEAAFGPLGARGSVVASEAFLPFADGLLSAIAAGATAVIQPGGSQRDAEVIAAADKAGIAMVFTGLRHFRH